MSSVDDPYIYSGTSILKNKFNCRNKREIEFKETTASVERMDQLDENPIKGIFDFKHLRGIHAYIFQDVWEWAGEPRTVRIAKSDMFALPQ